MPIERFNLLKNYTTNPEMSFDIIKTVSYSGACLVKWVFAMKKLAQLAQKRDQLNI